MGDVIATTETIIGVDTGISGMSAAIEVASCGYEVTIK